MTNDLTPLRLSFDDRGVATITLDSPANANAMTLAWGQAWKAMIAELAVREGLRVVHVRAEGKAFCVGGDISAFADTDDPRGLLIHLAGDLHDGLLALQALDAPLVVSVQGVAAGAGLSLVCIADIAVAGRSAAFVAAYTGAGLSPDGGMSWTLPRLVGTRRATEMMLTNRLVRADEAAEIGLVTETVDDDALAARADEVVATLAALSPSSLGATRRLIHQGATDTLETHLPREAMSIADLSASPAGQEGIHAFLEKRKPVFES